MAKNINKTSPKVLGLDVSTKTIGWALFDIQTKELLELTHISPVPKPKVENKIEELILKGHIFRKKLEDYVGMGITSVVIEEPLLNSNNIWTVGTLLRYNSMITKSIYDILGVIHFHCKRGLQAGSWNWLSRLEFQMNRHWLLSYSFCSQR